MVFEKKWERWTRGIGRRNLAAGVLALGLAGFPIALCGVQAAAPSDPLALDRAGKVRIIDWISRELKARYVFPDVAVQAEAFLREKFRAGKYDDISSRALFARSVSKDLVEIARDKHLHVRYTLQPSLDEDAKDEAEEKRRREIQRLNWRIENFKLKKLEHLDGNVGYFRFDGFTDIRVAGDTVAAALSFLGNCDALIIDLRSNNGGWGNMGTFILGYFFEKQQRLHDFYTRKDNQILQSWTPEYVLGPRLDKTKLFVLTGRGTASAAEAFLSNLKRLNRAVSVGETTSGAAHTADILYDKEMKIELTVSVGRPVDPTTGSNWEGVGIAPDVECPAADALDRAYELALKRLYERSDPKAGNERSWLKALWEYQETIAHPRMIETAALKAFEGSFGPARVFVEDGRLYVLDPDGIKSRLIFQGADVFLLEGNKEMRLGFDRDAAGEIASAYILSFTGTRSPRMPKARK
jgi:hypothetical protein